MGGETFRGMEAEVSESGYGSDVRGVREAPIQTLEGHLPVRGYRFLFRGQRPDQDGLDLLMTFEPNWVILPILNPLLDMSQR